MPVVTKNPVIANPGGQLTFCVYSGALILGSGGSIPVNGASVTGHAVWFSGGGVLNTIVPHQGVSGAAGFFYDSAVVARSGTATYAESGYRVVGVVPANTFGLVGVTGGGPVPIQVNVPFFSGLAGCFPSGMAGVTFTITPSKGSYSI